MSSNIISRQYLLTVLFGMPVKDRRMEIDMNFIKKCEKLKEQHLNDMIVQKNGTILLCPGEMPKARHYFFKGLEEQDIQKYLLNQYKWAIPKQYLQLLQYSNGIDLFNVRIIFENNTVFAESFLTIFGIPLKPYYINFLEEREPYSVWTENLGRHWRIPDWWLKVGMYYEKMGEISFDIWIDTKTEKVYICRKLARKVLKEWDNFDECLCSIFDQNKDEMQEYYIGEQSNPECLYAKKTYFLSKGEAKKLLKYLNKKLQEDECDGTLKYTEKWLKNNIRGDEKRKREIENEIKNDGGLCDCEVLMNCYDDYDDI